MQLKRLSRNAINGTNDAQVPQQQQSISRKQRGKNTVNSKCRVSADCKIDDVAGAVSLSARQWVEGVEDKSNRGTTYSGKLHSNRESDTMVRLKELAKSKLNVKQLEQESPPRNLLETLQVLQSNSESSMENLEDYLCVRSKNFFLSRKLRICQLV